MNDPNANPNAKVIHKSTRELVQKAAAAPYGEGVELIRRMGYWDAKAARSLDSGERTGEDGLNPKGSAP